MPDRVAAHLFVDDLEYPVVGDGDRHHIERVLRLRAGETVTVSDGRGGLRVCSYGAGAVLESVGEIEIEAPPVPSIAVGFALVKGDKPEWIVQKLSECGVDRILPFVAARSIVRWDPAKAARNLERLRRVSVEASMQSRRRWLPKVEPLKELPALLAAEESDVALADLAGDPPNLGTGSTVLIGPEGGWSDEERAFTGRFVRFGPTVLRAETAAVAAGVLLSALRWGAVIAVDGRIPRS